MRKGAALSAGLCDNARGVCFFNPLLGTQNKSVAAALVSNVTEFRNIKIRVIKLFPNSHEFNCIAGTHPMRDGFARFGVMT
ncbi:MAG: hypothetical protein LBS65_01275 [Desulfovibrio sp.]|jgi:hypothetical protein|nr:hypothetical protein [Desulfovibrio sp.]